MEEELTFTSYVCFCSLSASFEKERKGARQRIGERTTGQTHQTRLLILSRLFAVLFVEPTVAEKGFSIVGRRRSSNNTDER